MTRSDAELVARAQTGDVEAFGVLVERYHARCLRYALRFLHDHADAEDAVQDTFVRSFRALGGYRDRGRFDRWLFRILANQCRTLGARRQRENERCTQSGTDVKRGEGGAVMQRPPAPFLRARVQRALATLSPRLREALLLRDVEQMSYGDMAKITGDGVSALKMRVLRGRALMREALAEIGTPAGPEPSEEAP